jgi:hypothetical protein
METDAGHGPHEQIRLPFLPDGESEKNTAEDDSQADISGRTTKSERDNETDRPARGLRTDLSKRLRRLRALICPMHRTHDEVPGCDCSKGAYDVCREDGAQNGCVELYEAIEQIESQHVND